MRLLPCLLYCAVFAAASGCGEPPDGPTEQPVTQRDSASSMQDETADASPPAPTGGAVDAPPGARQPITHSRAPTAKERAAWPPATDAVKRLPQLAPFEYFGTPTLARAARRFQSGANLQAALDFEAFAAGAHDDDPRKLPARFMALLARHDAGDCEDTSTNLSNLAARWPLMAAYARFFAASCHLKAKRYDQATRLLDQHAQRWGVLRGRAALIALDVAEANATSALPLLRKLRVMDAPVNRMDIYNRMLGDATAAKNHSRVKDIRMLLVEHFTDTRSGRRALKALGGAAKLTPGESLRLGRALFDHHFHRDALKHLKAAADGHPRFSEPRCEALMMLGRTNDKMKRRGAAWRFHRRALGCTGDARYWATFAGGKNRFKARQYGESRRVLRLHIDEFGDRTTADDAALMIALGHRAEGDDAAADRVLKTMLTRWPEGDKADEAAWQLLWPHIKGGRWEVAEGVAAKLVEEMGRESHFRAEGRVGYWYGRILQKRGKADEANGQFQTVIASYPFSWYAVLAYSRLHAHSSTRAKRFIEAQSDKALADPRAPDLLLADKEWFDAHPAFRRAVEFLRMGLRRTARRELVAIAGSEGAAAPWARAWVLDAAGSHTAATVIARREEPVFGAWWPAPGSPATPLWKLAHPRPFSKSVRKWAKVRKIDPHWLWSIMREESNFNAGAVSWANAYGAMQIILPTAKALARKEGIAVSRSALFDPEISVRLGSRYLAGLLAKFGRIPLASPGYNAGGGAVNSWRKSPMGALPLDAFVEHIPYDEARGYAIRVTRSLARYSWLYHGRALRLDLSAPRPVKQKAPKQKRKSR